MQGAQNAIAIALNYAVSSSGSSGARSFAISDPVLGYAAGYPGVSLAAVNGAGELELPAASIAPQPLDLLYGDTRMMLNQTIPATGPFICSGWQTRRFPTTRLPIRTGRLIRRRLTSPRLTECRPPGPGSGPQAGAFCSTHAGDQYALPAVRLQSPSPTQQPPPLAGQANLLWVHEFAHSTGSGVLRPDAGQGVDFDLHAGAEPFDRVSEPDYGVAVAAPPMCPIPPRRRAARPTRRTNYPAPAVAYFWNAERTPFPWLQWNNRPLTRPRWSCALRLKAGRRGCFSISAAAIRQPRRSTTRSWGGIVLYPNYPNFPPGGVFAYSFPRRNNSVLRPFVELFRRGQHDTEFGAAIDGASGREFVPTVQIPAGTVAVCRHRNRAPVPLGTSYGIMNSSGASTHF